MTSSILYVVVVVVVVLAVMVALRMGRHRPRHLQYVAVCVVLLEATTNSDATADTNRGTLNPGPHTQILYPKPRSIECQRARLQIRNPHTPGFLITIIV